MSVHEGGALRAVQRQSKSTRVRFRGQEFLERERLSGEPFRDITLEQRRDLVAKAEHAARLETDHRHAALDEWRQRIENPLRLVPRFLDLADRQERAAAAQRARIAVLYRPCDFDPGSRGVEHGERRVDVLALEIALEGVAEEASVRLGPSRRLLPLPGGERDGVRVIGP